MTPGKVDLTRDHSHVAVIEKDGYQPAMVAMNRDVSMDVFMNFICIGVFPICFAVDFISGDAFEVKPDPVSVTLVPMVPAGAPAPTVAPAPSPPPAR